MRDYIHAHDQSVWPQTLFRKATFVSLKAAQLSPRVSEETIMSELMRPISVTYKNRSNRVPLGYVIAAKRAAKSWSGRKGWRAKMRRHEKRFYGWSAGDGDRKIWRRAMLEKWAGMVGGRRVSVRFMDSGWFYVPKILGPLIGGKYDRGAINSKAMRGSAKGGADPDAESLLVTIYNTAQSKSDKRGNFDHIGQRALEDALMYEERESDEYLHGRMTAEADKFNAAQR